MTRQLADRLRCSEGDLRLYIATPELFDFERETGVKPVGCSTACWLRGYHAVFAVVDGHLQIDELYSGIDATHTRLLGVAREQSAMPDRCPATFRNIRRVLPYTGAILATSPAPMASVPAPAA